jgi:hypothetical protein
VAAVPYVLNQNDQKHLANPSRIFSIGGDNGTEFYLNFPDFPYGQQWVQPFTYGFMYVMETPFYGAVMADASKTPPWGKTPAASTKQAFLAAYDTAQPFSAGTQGIIPGFTTKAVPISIPLTVTQAARVALNSGAGANVYGPWAEIIAAGNLPSDPAGLASFSITPVANSQQGVVQLGVGAVGFEVGVGEWGILSSTAVNPVVIPIFPLILLVGNPRVSGRIKDETGGIVWPIIRLEVYSLPL